VPSLVSILTIEERLIEATFLNRPNRFLTIVKLNNKTLPVFLTNPGRIHELLKPRVKVVLRELKKKGGKVFLI